MRLTVCLLASLLSCSVWAAAPGVPEVAARSFVLMDFESGQILAQKNADEPVEPASLTKMMTSYVISHELEAGRISNDDEVMISENAWAQNPKLKGSSLMFVEVNKTVPVGELHKGIVIQSGNDASIAMAEHIAGTEPAFASLMNELAGRLGLTNTHFENSTGLPAEGHLTSARDMAKLGAALIRDFPDEYDLYAVKEFTWNNIRQSNRNDLLWDASINVDGIKTGHTEAAGYCLVTSAEKDGMRLIAAVMGTNSTNARKVESKKLLNWGFRFFETLTPFEAGKPLQQVKIWKGETDTLNVGVLEPTAMTVPRNRQEEIEANYSIDKTLVAPITKGQEVGKIFIQLDGKDIAEFPLVALEEVSEGGFFSRLWDSIVMTVTGWFAD